MQMHKIVEDGAKPENLKEFVVVRKKGGVCQLTDIHNEPKLKILFGNYWITKICFVFNTYGLKIFRKHFKNQF